MENFAVEPHEPYGEFEDYDMEEEYNDVDEEDRGLLTEFVKERFLTKRKRLNEDDDSIATNVETRTIERSLANLSIDEVFEQAKSENLHKRLNAITQIRKLVLSSDDCIALFSDIQKNNILPVIDESLSSTNSQLQFEAGWILTNFTAESSELTKAIYNVFIPLKLVKLLEGNYEVNVVNQFLWTLGNIMVDNHEFCYQCISGGIAKPLKNQMKEFSDNVPFLQTVSWVMGIKSCLSKDSPVFKKAAKDLFPMLCELAKQQDDKIRINAILGLVCITKDMEMIMDFDIKIFQDIVPNLDSSSFELQAVTLLFLANCVTGNDEITQEIINCGALKHMNKLLNHSNNKFVEEATWMLSNILAGTNEQIDAVFEEAGLIPTIIGLLGSDDIKIKEKAVWAITNIPQGFAPKHVRLLLDLGIFPQLCMLLTIPKKSIIESILKAISEMHQQCSDRAEKIRSQIIACGAAAQIQQLQNHRNERIAKYANQIFTVLLNE